MRWVLHLAWRSVVRVHAAGLDFRRWVAEQVRACVSPLCGRLVCAWLWHCMREHCMCLQARISP